MQLVLEKTSPYALFFSNKRKRLQIGFSLLLFIFLTQSAVQAQSITVTSLSATSVCAGSDITLTFDTTNGWRNNNRYDNSTDYSVYLSDTSGSNGWILLSNFTTSGISYNTNNFGNTVGIQKTVTIPANSISGTTYKIAIDSNNPSYFDNNTYGLTIFSPATITGTTPASRNNSGSLTLGATASSGIIKWYSSPTGGSSLFTGTSYTTPSIATTTTYYVDATVNGCTSSARTAITATINSPLSVTPATLDFGYVANGGTSSIKNYTLSGQYLSGFSANISITAPANFQVSLSASSGFSSSIVVPYSTSNLADTKIYVRFQPTATDVVYNSAITNSGGGGTASVSVNGTSKSLCSSSGNPPPYSSAYQTSMTLVKFNTINNTSTKISGYSDYTSQITDVKVGSSYPLTVNLNTSGRYTVNAMAWIDWNQDGDFDDADETFELGSANDVTNGKTTLSPKSITIPCGAALGNTRMRVSAKYNSYPTSCENNFDGEVEDYTVNVIQVTPTTTASAICIGSTASLSAAGAVSGEKYRWYNATVGGTLLKTSPDNSDNSYTTEVLVETAIYWVSILNAGGCESTRTKVTATINPIPSAPGAITGTATQCPVLASQTYSISAVANASTYNWTVPTGWSITAGSGTTSITVTTGSAGQNGNITVTAGNSCGTSSAQSLAVTVSPAAPVTPGTITGTATQCPSLAGESYSISSVNNASTYTWTVPTGWAITAGQNTTSITVTTGSVSQNGNITVTAANTCGTSSAQTLAVTVNAASVGGTASANQNICSGSTPTNITLSGQTATIQWQSSSDNTTFTNIASATASTLTGSQMGTLTATMYYRAVVTSGVCPSAYSTTVTVTVASCINKWKGTISNDWNTPGNWTRNIVPAADDNIIFDDAPANHCLLDQDRSVTDITNAQSTYGIDLNGKKLTVKGNLLFSNGASIDASASNSTMQFSGTTVQTISSSEFKNNEVYNLNINNSNNVLLNGNLRLLNTLTNTSGLLDAFTDSPILTYAGSTIQTIGSNQFLGEKVYDLTIDNAIGVNVNTNFTVANTLLINVNKIVSVAPLYQLTALGTISNNGGTSGLILRSDATGTASLIHNSNNVPATVQRYISGPVEGWHFLSSPVSNQPISGSWLPLGSYGTGNVLTGTGYDLYLWDEPSFSFKYKQDASSIGWGSVHPASNFSVGRGYLYSVQATNPTKEFQGNLNNGTINYPITITTTVDPALVELKGFNLVGNPYPSSVDWQAASGWDRSKLEVSVDGYDVWVWNPTANNYGVFNSVSLVGTNSISRYLAPMQGYFVKAAGTGNLGFDNSVRTHTGAGNWFKNSRIKNGVIRVTVESEDSSGTDEALIQFGYSDSKQGAAKLFSHVATAPSLYMRSSNKDYSVRYVTDTAENTSVPVEFKAGKDGFYNLAFNFDSKEFVFAQLEDRLLKTYTSLKSSSTIRFKASITDSAGRFVLHFTEKDTIMESELAALVYMSENKLVVDLKAVSNQTEVKLFDITGKLILRKKLEGSKVHELELNLATQILLVSLSNEKGTFNTKVLYDSLK